MRPDDSPAWAIDGKEFEAWRAEREKITQELDPLQKRWDELIMAYAEIRDRGLSRTRGEGLRPAIVSTEELAEVDKIVAEMNMVSVQIRVFLRQLSAHEARLPAPKPRPPTERNTNR